MTDETESAASAQKPGTEDLDRILVILSNLARSMKRSPVMFRGDLDSAAATIESVVEKLSGVK